MAVPFFRVDAAGFVAVFAAALFAAHLFFVASEIAFLPAALSLRFGFAASGVDGSDSPRIAAHLARCAIAIFRREAAENFFRFPVEAPGVAAALAGPPESIDRRSVI